MVNSCYVQKTMVKEGEEAARVTFYDGEGSTIQSL